MHSSTGPTTELAPSHELSASALGFRDETHVSDRRGAAAAWAYFSSEEKQRPFTTWHLEVMTNPDEYIELSFTRDYEVNGRREEAFTFKGDLDLAELRQFAHMLQVVIGRLENASPAEAKWQQYPVAGGVE